MSDRTLVVANPQAANGAARRRFERALPRLREVLGDLDVEWTRAPRDAERIAREGVRAGVSRVVIAGGDGTIGEVVTGLLAADLGGYAKLGILPLGTGGDIARTLGIPRELNAAIELIAEGKARPVDAGRVRYTDALGATRSVFFANATSIGMGALVTQIVNRTTKLFGGTASFLIGTLRAIARFQPEPVTLTVDGEIFHEGPLVLAAAANGRYFGGGMKVAPEARVDDGLLDLVVIPGVSKVRLLRELPKIYAGTHLELDVVSSTRGRRIEATAAPRAVRAEMDGEPLGFLPLVIDVLPSALSFVASAP